MVLAGTASAGPPGALISNQAALDYIDLSGQTATVLSNEVSVVTAVIRSPSTLEFTRVVAGGGDFQETVGPSACLQSGAFVPLGAPTIVGGIVIDPALQQEVSTTAFYNSGEVAFLRLADSDQNLDYLILDSAVVTVRNVQSGDAETLQLTETGLDTGIFAGFVPLGGGPVSSGDCVLQSAAQSGIEANYTDPADTSDAAQSSAVLDPTQRVFESRTGALVSGTTIEILAASTGLPAIVFGNDGVSQFPSAIVSGGTTTDSSGTSYVFAPGEYRFPVVPDGDYRLLVTPPSAYSAPSAAAIADLQNLAGAPWALGPASFGQSFSKNGDLTIALDIPIDPLSSALFLQKRTLTTTAAPGDFIRYELTLENSSTLGSATDIIIVDQLPPGVRFVAGSVTVNGNAAPDPLISADLTSLQFVVPTLAIAERVQIFYVVEIIGGEKNSVLVNRATAFAAGGLLSNESSASVTLTEDLFRTTGTIIGRVLEASCSQDTFTEDQGIEDIRVYLEDGRYAVTDAGGRYHFEGIAPGTHVAQLDTFTIPDYFDVVGCAQHPGFAGRADSQFVKLSRGSLQRADFYLRRKEPPVGRVDIEMKNFGTDSNEEVAYEVTLEGIGNVATTNISLMVVLPDGVSYRQGSLRLNGETIGEPHLLGPSLSIALPAHDDNWKAAIVFVAAINADVAGELVTKAIAKFDTPMQLRQQTPLVETRMVRAAAVVEDESYVLDLKFAVLSDTLSAADKVLLDILIEDWRGVSKVQLDAIGHSDSQRISPRNQHLFANNYALSRARAYAAAFYVADALQLPVGDVRVDGRGSEEPVADNSTAAGRQQNRRVTMALNGIRPTQPSFLTVTQESSGTKEIATVGAIPGMEKQPARNQNDDRQLGMPASQQETAIESLRPGYAMLLPEKGYAPAIASTRISIQHEPGQSIELTINDVKVSKLNFDGIATNAAATIAITRWAGVPLADGANEIRAVIWNSDGSKAKAIRRTIYFTGAPIRAEIVAEKSTLVADGKSNPIIAVRLFDRSGKPSRTGMVGRFRVNAPYRSAFDEENERRNELVVVGNRSASYRVDDEGVAYLELAPTTQTGEVTVVLPFENYREQELRAWLAPAQRDWILVGFAEGTAGFNTLSDNVAAAAAAGHEDEYHDNGRVAFFAKGSIKGEYLLTIAYDSARDRKASRDRFDTVIDPNAYYSLYADRAEQRFEAASQRKLFVKLERNQFYALFGDFDTGLAVTDLARYQRRFNGLKTEYRGRNLGYSVFVAETDQSFHRDEIRGDGTSGLYQLSNTPIISNSESVRIEVRDRFDSGVVLSSQNLARFLDYSIDTLSGTLYFKRPVASRDFDFNPIFIVVEYESVAASTEDLVSGGRGSVRSSNDALEIGITHINDATQGSAADLTGIDLRWQINDQTILKAEVVDSNAIVSGIAQSGSAHSITLEHSGERVDVNAFIREVDDGFGLGYQSAADKGIRRVGLDARAKIGEHFSVEGEAGWQQNLSTNAVRNVARALLRFENGDFSARAGLAHATDKFDDGDERKSDRFEAGVAQRMMDGSLRVRIGGSIALDEDAENVDYPSSVVAGVDYKVFEGIELVAEYEDATGRDINASMTRLGVRASPWSRGQINSFVTREASDFGPRLFANLGLIQGFQFNEQWIVDVGIDHARTLVDPAARVFDTDRERTAGSVSEDFLALTTGVTYNNEDWTANARIERREADSEDRTTVLFGWYRAPEQGHGLSSGLSLFKSQLANGNELTSTNIKFAWAYRPADNEWSFLDRADLIFDQNAIGGSDEKTWRLINNFNANRRFSAATQLSLQYASKYVRSNFDGAGFSGYTDLIGVDLRHGFRARWDAGVNTSIYHSYRSKIIDYGVGIDLGYKVGSNMWLTLGYNFIGFEDQDFAAARYTASGPFLRFSIKADQQLLKRVAGLR